MKALKFSFLFFIFFLIVLSVNAQPIPPIPHTVKGNVYIDGNPAPAGTFITAKIGGDTIGEFATTVEGTYAIGIETPGIGGETAKLYVNRMDTGKGVALRAGAVDTMDLSVSSLGSIWFWVAPLAVAVVVIIIIALKYGKKQR